MSGDKYQEAVETMQGVVLKYLMRLAKIEKNVAIRTAELRERNPELTDELVASASLYTSYKSLGHVPPDEEKTLYDSFYSRLEMSTVDPKYKEEQTKIMRELQAYADFYFEDTLPLCDVLKLAIPILIYEIYRHFMKYSRNAQFLSHPIALTLVVIIFPFLEILNERDKERYSEIMQFYKQCMADINWTIANGWYATIRLERSLKELESIPPLQEVGRFIFGLTDFENQLFAPSKDNKKKIEAGLMLNGGNLGPYDREIYAAVISLWCANNKFITPQMIFHVLSGCRQSQTRISIDQRRQIINSLKKMHSTEIEINSSEFANNPKFHYKNKLLPYVVCKNKKVPGQKEEDYAYIISIEAEPPLYSYTKNENECYAIKSDMLNLDIAEEDAHITSVTYENVVLRGYLLRKIVRANDSGTRNRVKIDCKQLYKFLKVESVKPLKRKTDKRKISVINKKCKSVIEKVRGYLNFWNHRGEFIVNMKMRETSKTLEITYDDINILDL